MRRQDGRSAAAACRFNAPSSRSAPRPLQLTVRGVEDVVDEADLLETQDDEAVEIDLPPGVRDISVPREAMMVVVQTLAEGEDRGHELVGRGVVDLEAAIAVSVADRAGELADEDEQISAEEAGKQDAADHRMQPAENVADHTRDEDRRHPKPDPACSHEEHRDRIGQDVDRKWRRVCLRDLNSGVQ